MHSQISKQNNPELLKFLKASTVAYSTSRSKEFLFSYGLFFLSIAYPISYIFIKNENAKYTLFIISFLITVLSWVFADYFKGNTSKGALYKEKFDALLFGLPWKFMLAQPDTMDVTKLSKKYRGEDLVNWYPPNISDIIPSNTVIAICQRVNSGWDIELRTKYRTVLITIFTIYTTLIFLLWTITSQDGRVVFLLYFSTLSYYAHLITLIRGNTSVIDKRQKIVNKLDSYINEKRDFTKDNLRDVQDEIYSARQEPSKVPDTIFRIYKKELMEVSEEYIININKTYIS